ncbi:MAG: tetratricopeptide repeat protein [Candidatus Omnitrophota bacterium]
MKKIIIFTFLFVSLVFAPAPSNTAFSASAAAEFLCELGVKYYRTGKYEDALLEFKRALLVDPSNQTAQNYINTILQSSQELSQTKPVQKKQAVSVEKSAEIKKQAVPLESKKIKSDGTGVKEKAFSKDAGQNKKLEMRQERREIKPDSLMEKKGQVKQEVNLGKGNKEGKSESARKDIINSALNKTEFARKNVINKALDKLEIIPQEKPDQKKEQVSDEKKLIKSEGIDISGEAELRFGVSSDNHGIWKQANWDLNEKNWRMLSGDALNGKENSFDTRVYDRIKIQLDTDKKTGLAFHTNITVDPWSFTGKSSRITVNSDWGDNADVELKYWSNSGYTIDQTILSNSSGNSFSLPELKVKDGRTNAVVVDGAFTNAWGQHDKFNIPALEIEPEFQPIREFWFAYNEENLKVKFFPIAYENQALTFNDPLRLSNNRAWWEDSPWIRRWRPGMENRGTNPVDFSKGY